MAKNSLSGPDLAKMQPDGADFKGHIRTRKPGRPKNPFAMRLRPMLTPEHLEIEHGNLAEITLTVLRETIAKQKLPKSACTSYKQRQHLAMDNDCEDCRAIYSYARIMKVPLGMLRDIDHHRHLYINPRDNHPITFVDINNKVESDDEDELRLYETLPSEEPTPERSTTNRELLKHLCTLARKKQTIIYERFWNDKSLEDIGTQLGYTKQNVSLLQNKALRYLRNALTETNAKEIKTHGLQFGEPDCHKQSHTRKAEGSGRTLRRKARQPH